VEVKASSLAAGAAMEANNPDLFWLWGWAADMNDPQNFLAELFQTDKSYNWGKTSNPEFDKLVKLADNPSNPEFRQRKYIEAERILTEIDFALIPLYHTP
jgi:oligopeptide transport system substrate-binding protein